MRQKICHWPPAPAIAMKRTTDGKTGPVAATYVKEKATCPKACFFRVHNLCYGYFGPISQTVLRINGSPITDTVKIAEIEAALVDTLTAKVILRYHIHGDFADSNHARVIAQANDRYFQRVGKRGWAYTHRTELEIPREAYGNIVIWRSVETADAARKAIAAGFKAAIVLPVHHLPTRKVFSWDGLDVFPCPADTGAKKNCFECGYCANPNAKLPVAFPAHGARYNAGIRQLNVLNGHDPLTSYEIVGRELLPVQKSPLVSLPVLV